MAEYYLKTQAIIKDSLLIDNSLLVNFWVEAMNIINYLSNQLLTKCDRPAFILKEAWISIR